MMDQGCSKLRGNSKGSLVDHGADSGSGNASGGVEHWSNLVGESWSSNLVGESWSNLVGESNGCRGSNSVDKGCRCDNGSRGSRDNGVDETILIQIFTEAFKGERPEPFGGCDSVTTNKGGGRARLGSLDDGSDSLGSGASSSQEGSKDNK